MALMEKENDLHPSIRLNSREPLSYLQNYCTMSAVISLGDFQPQILRRAVWEPSNTQMPLIILREYSLKRKMKNSCGLPQMMSVSLSRSFLLSQPGKTTQVMALTICFLLDCRVNEFFLSFGQILAYLLLLRSLQPYPMKMPVLLPPLLPLPGSAILFGVLNGLNGFSLSLSAQQLLFLACLQVGGRGSGSGWYEEGLGGRCFEEGGRMLYCESCCYMGIGRVQSRWSTLLLSFLGAGGGLPFLSMVAERGGGASDSLRVQLTGFFEQLFFPLGISTFFCDQFLLNYQMRSCLFLYISRMRCCLSCYRSFGSVDLSILISKAQFFGPSSATMDYDSSMVRKTPFCSLSCCSYYLLRAYYYYISLCLSSQAQRSSRYYRYFYLCRCYFYCLSLLYFSLKAQRQLSSSLGLSYLVYSWRGGYSSSSPSQYRYLWFYSYSYFSYSSGRQFLCWLCCSSCFRDYLKLEYFWSMEAFDDRPSLPSSEEECEDLQTDF